MKTPSATDIEAIIGLYKQAGWWNVADDDNIKAGKIVIGSHAFLVARIDGQIIGMARAISDRASDAYIQDVTVLSGFRGRGIARAMIDKLLDRLHADGVFWVALIAERGSSRLYEHSGFKPMENSTPMINLTLP